jgi:hypothetical protein
METNIRQADNKVKAEGLLSEKNLELVTDKEKDFETIKGTVTVQTSEDNFVTFKIFCSSKTVNGKDNGIYQGIKTIYDSYKSIADFGANEADRVRINQGQLNPYTSIGQNGEEREGISYRTNFINRVKQTEVYDPKAAFEVEMFIVSMIPEIEHEVETGRTVVKGILPLYNGIEYLTLILPKSSNSGDWVSLIQQDYGIGKTGRFFGDLVNRRVEMAKVTKLLGGGEHRDISYRYKNELVITGASAPYDEGDAMAYSPEVIKAALTERQIDLEKRAADRKANVGHTGGFGMNKPIDAASHRTAPVPNF